MKVIKKLYANIFIVMGSFFESLGNKLIMKGLDLHVKFQTDLGAKICKIQKAVKSLEGIVTKNKENSKKRTNNKLKSIIEGTDDNKGKNKETN